MCLQADRTAIGGAVDRLLAPFRCPATVDVAYRYSLSSSDLHRDEVLMLRSTSWPELLNRLLSDLNYVAVDGFHGFAVHAGVVAQGETVVAFPGASDAGKSTLTAACLSAGFNYLSDEALCVDFDSDAVVPYPKPLKLSHHGAALAGLIPPPDEQELLAVRPEDLGARVATGALRLGHVVQFARRPGPPVLQPRDRSETVATLLTLSFNHYRNPLPSFQLATRLAVSARSWRLEYQDPRPAAFLLRDLWAGAGC